MFQRVSLTLSLGGVLVFSDTLAESLAVLTGFSPHSAVQRCVVMFPAEDLLRVSPAAGSCLRTSLAESTGFQFRSALRCLFGEYWL